MTLVTTQMSLSLDGCYAGPEQEDMSDWIHGTEAGGFMRVTRWVINAMGWRERQGYEGGERDTNSQILEGQFAEAGAYVMGRRMFDGGELPWGEEPPFRAPVFVVTHREREPLERKGGTTFTFVTDGIESAVAQAKAAAGDKNGTVAGGGRLTRQVLAAGLLDRLDLHIVPVVLGEGMRLLDPALGLDPMEAIELTPERVIATPDVTHVRYAVQGRAPLVADDRGSGRPIEKI